MVRALTLVLFVALSAVAAPAAAQVPEAMGEESVPEVIAELLEHVSEAAAIAAREAAPAVADEEAAAEEAQPRVYRVAGVELRLPAAHNMVRLVGPGIEIEELVGQSPVPGLRLQVRPRGSGALVRVRYRF